MIDAGNATGRPSPDTLFPLVRHLSVRTTPLLARTPLTPNQITVLSILTGLGAVALLLLPGRTATLTASALFVVSYVLDNCDGEIARLKNMSSAFGAKLDTFGDWLVNAAFFAALGAGTTMATGHVLWAWLGWIAAAGATINYVLRLWLDRRIAAAPPAGAAEPERHDRPQTMKEWAVHILRELFRADFCFIVLGLAAFDALWLLLPAAAAGAQAYWVGLLFTGGKDYHV